MLNRRALAAPLALRAKTEFWSPLLRRWRLQISVGSHVSRHFQASEELGVTRFSPCLAAEKVDHAFSNCSRTSCSLRILSKARLQGLAGLTRNSVADWPHIESRDLIRSRRHRHGHRYSNGKRDSFFMANSYSRL